jgi:outer membrane lipopolysaccharide assembly protein LptE/RlpB
MKALFVTVLLVTGLHTASSAQKQDRHAELPGASAVSQSRLSEITRQMSNDLRLNEAQYIRLRAVNKIKLARLDEISWQYRSNPIEQQARIGELEAQYEAECSRILSPSQLSALQNDLRHDAVPATDPLEGGIG